MFKKINITAIGIFFILTTGVYAGAGPGKGPGVANGQQVSVKIRNRSREQIQIYKYSDPRQDTNQTRKRTNYSN